MRGGSEKKSREKLAGPSLEVEEDDTLGSGAEIWTKAWAGRGAAAGKETGEMEVAMMKVEGSDCRQVLIDAGDAPAACCPCLSAAAMQLNHCVNAAISLPVALFITASGIPPAPPVTGPDAVGEARESEEDGIAEPADVLPLVRGVAALRQMHSSNCRLAGGDDTDT
jgi:hypothetical protein